MTKGCLLTTITTAIFLLSSVPAFAATNHLVISEIQIGNSEDADNEYVELFNPSSSPIDITGMRLRVGASTNLVSSMSGTISPNSFYLVAKPSFSSISIAPDTSYSAASSSITANSYITLYAADLTSVVDRVGMGTATVFETSPALAPTSTQNLHRTDLCNDTDNNSTDFSLSAPTPQNSSSSFSCQVAPSPSPTPITPSSTPSATPSPSATPNPSNTPAPSSSPTPSPAPTTTPKPPVTPPLPTPTTKPPSPPSQTYSNPLFTCTVTYQPKSILNLTVYFPRISCNSNK